ncbi:MAG: replication initiation protein [Prevotella sp.]|nr:replication initiation protein [Prevotella sp.]
MNTSSKNIAKEYNRSDVVFVSSSAYKLPIRIRSIYEWRILGLIMLKMKSDFGDHKFIFKDGIDLINQKRLLDSIRFNKRSFGSPFKEDEVEILFPINLILNRDEQGKLRGYDNVRKALYSLSRTVEVENASLKKKMFDKESKENGIIWGLAQVIEKPEIRKYNGNIYVYFRVPERTWEVLCHWENGVHIFELSVFFKFKRAASVLFYILLADYREKGWLVLPTKKLKEHIAPGEYRDYSLFKNKVIIPVQEDLRKYSPFYFEIKEYKDNKCEIPARRGRWFPANYAKIVIFYQKDKNTQVDERIDLFLNMNRLSAFKLDDLTQEERNFLSQSLSLPEIKGKNLETIVKLKYYKNYGHENVRNWRNNAGNFFMEYLKGLYDTIMLSDKPINDIAAYAIRSMQKVLETYEPTGHEPEKMDASIEQEMKRKDSPIRSITNTHVVPSHEQDLAWLNEFAKDREWKDVMKQLFNLKYDFVLAIYWIRFRQEIVSHPGHKSKQDLLRHFKNLMGPRKDGRGGWASRSEDSYAFDNDYIFSENIREDSLYKLFEIPFGQDPWTENLEE